MLILKGLMGARSEQVERLGGAGFARGPRRTGWGANFISYDSAESVCCQEKYILGELLVRTDWEVIGRARVTEDQYAERDGMTLPACGRHTPGEDSREGYAGTTGRRDG